MKTKATGSIVGLALLIIALLAPATFGQISSKIADTEVSPASIAWYPNTGDYESLSLTVSGPGDLRIERVFGSAERPSLATIDEAVGALPDGSYTYELRLAPRVSDEIRSLMAESRANDDRELAKRIRAMVPEHDVQFGYFRVEAGAITVDDGDEPRGATRPGEPNDGPIGASAEQIVGVTAADFVINDDLIVDGSACIGFDCVNGEVFSFDTIRLKENNLRIKFDDTSVAASFPRNDWQLTANESANGGASKFSIEDISGGRTPFTVEANARSHSLYVDDGGRIGSRTSTPSVEIHTIDGDTPTLRLQQDASSGFEPQTWDVAGNETNFFVRDVTNGSALPLRIRPGAPSSSIFVDVDGDVGLGTASPDASLEVTRGDGSTSFRIDETTTAVGTRDLFEMINGGGDVGFTATNGVAGHEWRVVFRGGAGAASGREVAFRVNPDDIFMFREDGSIESTNGAELTAAGVWTNASSRALKDDIASLPIDQAVATLQGLDPVTFRYKALPDELYAGFIAEDVPELVASPGRKGLAPMDIVAVLTKVMQQQQQQLLGQQEQIEELMHRVEELGGSR